MLFIYTKLAHFSLAKFYIFCQQKKKKKHGGYAFNYIETWGLNCSMNFKFDSIECNLPVHLQSYGNLTCWIQWQVIWLPARLIVISAALPHWTGFSETRGILN